MLFTKLTLCSQIRNIVLKVAMNLVFIYLGEECLVITYSASCATMCLLHVISGPAQVGKNQMILDSFTKSLRIFLRIEKRMASSTTSSDHFLYFAFGSNLLTERIHINNHTSASAFNKKLALDKV